MSGLGPDIHVFLAANYKDVDAGPSPGTRTREGRARVVDEFHG
jgi:hypothetical protein